ncbi:hypothetical protein [Actinophytocola sp.]|uniref:hypothetical protein n=1 Tax=Actinophytocola sp. TaxID=1872138 RepID=UPI00389ACA3C
MPWVREHRRRTPYGLFGRRTTVRSHYRRSPGHSTLIAAIVVVVVILILIALF